MLPLPQVRNCCKLKKVLQYFLLYSTSSYTVAIFHSIFLFDSLNSNDDVKKKKSIFSLSSQNRHAVLTTIFVCQASRFLSTFLKKEKKYLGKGKGIYIWKVWVNHKYFTWWVGLLLKEGITFWLWNSLLPLQIVRILM